MKKCFKCNQEMPESEKFCMKCGADLSQEPAPEAATQPTAPDKTKKSKGKLAAFLLGGVGLLIIGVVVVAVIGAGIWWFFLRDSGQQTNNQTTGTEELKLEADLEITKRIPTAFYNNADVELLAINFKSNKDVKVKVEVEVPDVTEKITKEIDLKTGETKEKFKPPILKEAYGPLDKAQEKPVEVKITNVDSGEVVKDTSEQVAFLSRNDMVWISEDGYDNYKYIARWITKDNKEVKELVRKAADYNDQFCGQHSMIGYLGGEQAVLCQLASIFAAMREHYEITYIKSAESYTTTNAQSIRLPEEVLMEKSGLCIETAVTVAAALENLDMEPVIIFIPGHAWVAVKTYAGSPRYFHLESTMLESTVTVQDALDQGDFNWWQNSGQATVIDIKEARDEGILPYGEIESASKM